MTAAVESGDSHEAVSVLYLAKLSGKHELHAVRDCRLHETV